MLFTNIKRTLGIGGGTKRPHDNRPHLLDMGNPGKREERRDDVLPLVVYRIDR